MSKSFEGMRKVREIRPGLNVYTMKYNYVYEVYEGGGQILIASTLHD